MSKYDLNYHAFYNNDVAANRKNVINYSSRAIPVRLNGYNTYALIDELADNTVHSRYLNDCLVTWNVKDCPDLQIGNAALGLVGELLEYNEDPDIDELGDVLYYRTIFKYLMCDSLEYSNLSYEQLKSLSKKNHPDIIQTMHGLLLDVGKKVAYHGKYDTEKTRERYYTAISILDDFILYQFDILNKSFEEVYSHNINKLSNRHGKTFNPGYTV